MARAKTFGRQPARVEIFKAGLTMAGVARDLRLTENQVRQAIRGTVAPSPELRKGLCRLLELPVEKLFTAEALAARYDASKNPWKPLEES